MKAEEKGTWLDDVAQTDKFLCHKAVDTCTSIMLTDNFA